MKNFLNSWMENLQATANSIIEEGNIKKNLAMNQAMVQMTTSILSAGISVMGAGVAAGQGAGQAEATMQLTRAFSQLSDGVGSSFQKILEANAQPALSQQQVIQMMGKAMADAYDAMFKRQQQNVEQQNALFKQNTEERQKVTDSTYSLFRG